MGIAQKTDSDFSNDDQTKLYMQLFVHILHYPALPYQKKLPPAGRSF